MNPSPEQGLAPDPELWRISAFQRVMGELETFDEGTHEAVGITALSSSLRADLAVSDGSTASKSDLLETIAACLRHTQNVALHLSLGDYVVPITMFPRDRLYHTPQAANGWLQGPIDRLRLLQIEPAVLHPPGHRRTELIGNTALYHPLDPLLWRLALQGPRQSLLSEIDGPALYHVAAYFNIAPAAIALSQPQQQSLRRLQQEGMSLADLSEAPGMDARAAAQLLNALYLQGGLITHRLSLGHLSNLSTSATLEWMKRQWLRWRG